MNKFSKLILVVLVGMTTLGSCTKAHYQSEIDMEEQSSSLDKDNGEGKDTNGQNAQGTGG